VSRIGKVPIPIPSGVTVTIEGKRIHAKGPKGSLHRDVHPKVNVNLVEGHIQVQRNSDEALDRALHGLTRALLANLVHGVSQGYRKSMEIVGVGYKVELRDKSLVFTIGYSHPVMLMPPPGVAFEVEKPTLFHINGMDKELVGQIAAKARAIRPPDAYKGKGIRYAGEHIRLKAGKTSK
jgi:large subunit ribosomal protein L6